MTATDATTRVVSEFGNDVGPGQRLREAREAAKLTLAEVASRMRLEPQVLELLEHDRYEQLHGATFVRGYLSGYARLLDLPERPILEAYARHGYGPPALVSELGSKPEVHVSDFPVRMVTYVIAGLLVVLVVLWWQSRQPPIGGPDYAQPSPASEPQAGGGPAQDGESVDTPAAPGPRTTDNTAGIAPMEETAEPAQTTSDSAHETAGDSDGQQPQGAASREQMIGTDSPHAAVPPDEDAQAGESPGETPISAQHVTAAPAVDSEASSETAGESASSSVASSPGEAHSATQPVAAAPDSTDTADTDNSAGLEEQTPRPEPLAGSDLLAIQLARESWVEIYDRGGGRLYYNLAREGSQVVVQGAGPMRVLLGDVEGAVVAYNGEPYDLGRYQGRSVVRFTIGELSSTAPAPAEAQ
jgi:cytoskeleton protein RodZ